MIYLTRHEQRLAILLCILLILSVVVILVKRFQPGLYLRASMGSPDFNAKDRPVNQTYRTFERQPIEPRQTQKPTAEQAEAFTETKDLPISKSDHEGTFDKININTASREELERLPLIGPVKAQAIIDYRKEKGPFSSPEQIMNVKGIGEKTFQRIRDKIKVQD